MKQLGLLVLTMSSLGWAKGPIADGLFQATHEGRTLKIQLASFNIPGTTVRFQSCNIHYGCSRKDTLTSKNIFSKQQEAYMREVVTTKKTYSPEGWTHDYAYITTDGQVLPMAKVFFPRSSNIDGPDELEVTIRGKEITFEKVR